MAEKVPSVRCVARHLQCVVLFVGLRAIWSFMELKVSSGGFLLNTQHRAENLVLEVVCMKPLQLDTKATATVPIQDVL